MIHVQSSVKLICDWNELYSSETMKSRKKAILLGKIKRLWVDVWSDVFDYSESVKVIIYFFKMKLEYSFTYISIDVLLEFLYIQKYYKMLFIFTQLTVFKTRKINLKSIVFHFFCHLCDKFCIIQGLLIYKYI